MMASVPGVFFKRIYSDTLVEFQEFLIPSEDMIAGTDWFLKSGFPVMTEDRDIGRYLISYSFKVCSSLPEQKIFARVDWCYEDSEEWVSLSSDSSKIFEQAQYQLTTGFGTIDLNKSSKIKLRFICRQEVSTVSMIKDVSLVIGKML